MSTLTLELDDQTANRLAEAARERGLQIEELLRQIADDFLAQTRPAGVDFKKALTASVTENEELLRRLAK